MVAQVPSMARQQPQTAQSLGTHSQPSMGTLLQTHWHQMQAQQVAWFAPVSRSYMT